MVQKTSDSQAGSGIQMATPVRDNPASRKQNLPPKLASDWLPIFARQCLISRLQYAPVERKSDLQFAAPATGAWRIPFLMCRSMLLESILPGSSHSKWLPLHPAPDPAVCRDD